jgi:hypothetical protein
MNIVKILYLHILSSKLIITFKLIFYSNIFYEKENDADLYMGDLRVSHTLAI